MPKSRSGSRGPKRLIATGYQSSKNPFSIKGIKVSGVRTKRTTGFTSKQARRNLPKHMASGKAARVATSVARNDFGRGYRGIAQKGGVKQFRADSRRLKAVGYKRVGLGQYKRRRTRRNYKGQYAGSY